MSNDTDKTWPVAYIHKDEHDEIGLRLSARIASMIARVRGETDGDCPFCETVSATGHNQDCPMCHLCQLEANQPQHVARIAELEAEAVTLRQRLEKAEGVVEKLLPFTNEVDRQNQKWGEQNHPPITWAAILFEECGELAQAALHHKFGGDKAAGLRDEAIQCAAVAMQIVWCLDRQAPLAAESAKEGGK